MANTFTKIATVTVGSGGASSIDFSSISSSYTDLCVLLSARNSANVAGNPFGGASIQFNGTTTNYSSRVLYGYGSNSGSASYTDERSIWGYITSQQSTANAFGNTVFYIPNYASSNYKSVSVDSVNENNATDGRQNFTAGLWSNTAAISSIKLITQDNNGTSANFSQYTTATLYGISNS